MNPFYNILDINETNFDEAALSLFRFQHRHNIVYRNYCNALNIDPSEVNQLHQIPFLPISLFKTHSIITTEFNPQQVFESSGTTGTIASKHFIRDLDLYKKSFMACFELFYGSPTKYCFLALLPSYLERNGSSLLYMVQELMDASQNENSGFYLYNHDELHQQILQNEQKKQPVFLIGVTYALIDFAEKYPMQLSQCTVVETGGMKGRRAELTRHEVHEILSTNFGLNAIHSEYGMTELLSQAWSHADGIFSCPPWMKVLLRAEDDPLQILPTENKSAGAINIIDLANVYSCAFIATEDMGIVHPNGRFEVSGRLDQSDLRGCGLMIV